MLPEIKYPVFDLTIPSTGKTVKIRPYLCREEKILLLTKETHSFTATIDAIRTIIHNCLLTDIDVETLKSYDLEYIFLQLRGFSVSDKIEFSYHDADDDTDYNFSINVSDIQVVTPEGHDKTIQLDENMGLILEEPPVLFDDSILTSDKGELTFKIMMDCIKNVYNGDEIIQFSDAPEEERKKFFDSLPQKATRAIRKYITTLPHIEYEIKYKNRKGIDKVIAFKSLFDFFILH